MAKGVEKKRARIVVIGGGTGAYATLRGLKAFTPDIELRAIVTMADSGGSTGRLRDEFGYLPVGDVRLALTALAREEGEYAHILRKLFLYRFQKGEGLTGHTFGNLLLVALTDIMGREEAAISAAASILGTCGEVIPVTTDKVHLRAVYDDGRTVVGEHEIDTAAGGKAQSTIREISLLPHARPNARALEAISSADLIVLGPGDLYTSILANCVVDGIAYALRQTRGKIVYISNLMTRYGQTNGMGTKEHLDELSRYLQRSPDYMIVNSAPFPESLTALYASEGEHPVVNNYDGGVCTVLRKDVLATHEIVRVAGDVLRRSLLRHDPTKLARAIMSLV